MIRLSTTHPDTGDIVVMLILEPENLTRLRQDNPVLLDLRTLVPDLPHPLQLMIAYTSDPDGFVDRLKETATIHQFSDYRDEGHTNADPPVDFTYPLCTSCDRPLERLGMMIAEDKRTGMFFCSNCGHCFAAQFFGAAP